MIRLLTVLTDPVMFPTSINGNLTKIDIYNKKVIEGFMLEYKQSFHNALLWVKLREKIAQFLRKESTKSSPGMTKCIIWILLKVVVEVDHWYSPIFSDTLYLADEQSTMNERAYNRKIENWPILLAENFDLFYSRFLGQYLPYRSLPTNRPLLLVIGHSSSSWATFTRHG